MNRGYTFHFLFIALVSIFLCWSCEQDRQNTTANSNVIDLPLQESEKELEAGDFKPSEQFFLQRTPYASEKSVNHYFSNLKEAQQKALTRNNPFGFDADWSVKGPNNFGGRVNTLAMPPNQEDTIYAGFAVGGVYRTYDGGLSWTPIFNDLPSMAVGHLALDPNNSNTLYLGTGDPNIWGYPFLGSGLYKSEDRGDTWEYLGLQDTRIISKVIPHPSNSDILYVSTMGLPFVKDDKRGVYKTIDGGVNWTKVLEISDSTGVPDLIIHPDHPDTLIAAGWDRVRNSLYSRQDGRGAGVYRTVDGGNTWQKLNGGLPQGRFSRVGLGISSQNPDHIFALYVGVDYQFYGLFKSVDAGENWTALTLGTNNGLRPFALGGFGWYFGKMYVDPFDEDHLFIQGVNLWETKNSGDRWTNVNGPGPNGETPHVDHHALSITPSGNWIAGTDGGVFKFDTLSKNWESIEELAVTQFYQTAYNPNKPDYYYGGAQDNGTLGGPGGQGSDWLRLHGGDGFKPYFHPTDSNYWIIEVQYGALRYTNNNGQTFTTAQRGIDINDQINWDMPYAVSYFNPMVMYAGTHRMYKVNDITQNTWQPISDTLTDPVIQIPTFHNISSIALSPLDSNLVISGTSDGNVWKSENGGQNWQQINSTLPDNYVSSLAASHLDPDRIFVSFSAYKDPSPSDSPLIFRSDDRGQNWMPIHGDLPDLAINDVLLFPTQDDNYIFVATDGGVYATQNGGQNWQRLGGNMPFFPVYDLEFNYANNELIAATFSRSIQTFDLSEIGLNLNGGTINLSGIISKESGTPIGNVQVNITQGGATTTQVTDASGSFSMNNLADGEQIQVEPIKNTNHRNGLSTFDIILTAKHVTGLDPLGSPYQLIAADVNNSGSVSTFDIIDIRKMILFIDTAFADNTSWRFVPEDYVFPNPSNPFSSSFPEVIDISINDQSNLNFVGIKIGDINGSANPNLLRGELMAESRDESIMLKQVEEGQEIKFLLTENRSLVGFQLSLSCDGELLGLDSKVLQNFGEGNYHWDEKLGVLNISWDYAEGQELIKGDELFKLTLKSKSANVNINENWLSAELYTSKLEILNIESKITSIKTIENRVNITNPVRNYLLKAKIELNKIDQLKWSVYSVTGQKVESGIIELSSGKSTINIPLSDRLSSGIYYLEFRGKNWRETSKLLIE